MMLVRRLVLAVFGSVLLAVGIGGVMAAPVFATGDANRTQCSPETEASPGFRGYLPDCRAYELVTPPFKDSALVLGIKGGAPVAVSENGEQVLTMMGGAFAGAGNLWFQGNLNPDFDAYELTRTASGWQPTAITPPATEYPYSDMMAASPVDLGTTLWGATTSKAIRNAPSVNEDIYVRGDSGVFSLVGPGVAPEEAGRELDTNQDQLALAGASSDLTRLLFTVVADPGPPSDLWPGDTTVFNGSSLYEYSYDGAPSAEPALVGVSNEGPLQGSPLNQEAKLISNCSTVLGSAKSPSAPTGSLYNAVTASGETVFFTASACGGTPVVNELYARVAGKHTVAVSEPPLAGPGSVPGRGCTGMCAEAEEKPAERREGVFEGASSDGSKVFFLTEQPLVNSDTDATTDLYMAEFEGQGASAKIGRLVLVSDGEPGVGTPGSEKADVQGVVRVSEDGSHVYFVAKGALAGKNAEGNAPEAGADNLYVYNTGTGRTVFVGTLLNAAEEASIAAAESKEQTLVNERAIAKYGAKASVVEHEFERGEISEERKELILSEAREEETVFRQVTLGILGPSGTLATDSLVWGRADDRPAQATPNGEFLVFLSSAHLTPDDESNLVPQLFEYDAATEKLTRVSIGQGESYEHDGAVETFRDAPSIPFPGYVNADRPTAAQAGVTLSGDGSRVFFTSGGRLTPEAAPGATNAYEYREGNVYLISDGRDASTTEDGAESTVELFGVDPSGGDVFFTTADKLVPQDAESQQVLYDAREEGGFPAPLLTPGCFGEACRGSSATTPQLPSSASSSQEAGDNAAPPPPASAVVKPKSKAKAEQCKKGFVKKDNKCVKKKKPNRAKKAKRASRDRRGK
jgi:hypothetical protein